MIDTPSPNGANGDGRDPATGPFAPGWKGGPGNPHAQRVGSLRSALLNAVTDEDISTIMAKLVELAKSGDIRAAKEIIDRVLGKPIEADLMGRIEALEQLIERSRI